VEKFQRILLIQTGDIGDVVLTAPAVPAILETWPGAQVSLLVFKPYGALFQADPNFHQIIEVNRRPKGFLGHLREFFSLLIRLRQQRFDLAVDLRTGDRGAILAGMSGAKVRVGRPRETGRRHFWLRWLFNRWAKAATPTPPQAHPGADQILRVLRDLGVETKNSTPRLYLSSTQQALCAQRLAALGLISGGYFTASIWSRWPYKHWRDERWLEVFEELWRQQPYPILLLGDAGQRSAAQALAGRLPGKIIPLAGETSLLELPALIAGSRLHLSVDTAAAHMAAALNVPVLTIFGPSDWRSWRRPTAMDRLVLNPRFACQPCNRKGCEDSNVSACLEELPVAEVNGVLAQLMAGEGYARRLADFSANTRS
jgi:heptosyltransferase-3